MNQELIEIVNIDLWTNKIRKEEVNFLLYNTVFTFSVQYNPWD